jgi:hypothetical protein
VRYTVWALALGFAVFVLVWALTGRHVFFLPLLLVLPLGSFFGRRRR